MNSTKLLTAVSQNVEDKDEAGEETEAESTHSLLDPDAHRQHYQVFFVLILIIVKFFWCSWSPTCFVLVGTMPSAGTGVALS